MGSSGSGKSTLMNILGCLDVPTAGSYVLDGIRVEGLSRNELADLRNQKLGFVFQGFNLLPRTSAVENVELPLLYDRTGRWKNTRELAAEALRRVGLGERLEHQPSELSGGQQQRVAIARALVTQPTLLLADEPTGNLDSRTTVEVMALFQALNEQGITVIIVTHEPDIAQYAHRVIDVRDGRITDAITPSTAPRRAADDVLTMDAELDALANRCDEGGSMKTKSLLLMATGSILKNKMRTMLTMLGIVIGVGAVIVMVAVGNGAQTADRGADQEPRHESHHGHARKHGGRRREPGRADVQPAHGRRRRQDQARCDDALGRVARDRDADAGRSAGRATGARRSTACRPTISTIRDWSVTSGDRFFATTTCTPSARWRCSARRSRRISSPTAIRSERRSSSATCRSRSIGVLAAKGQNVERQSTRTTSCSCRTPRRRIG